MSDNNVGALKLLSLALTLDCHSFNLNSDDISYYGAFLQEETLSLNFSVTFVLSRSRGEHVCDSVTLQSLM